MATNLYLEHLIDRNEQLKSITNLENQFENYNSTKLESLYGYAQNNGLVSGWTPSVTNFYADMIKSAPSKKGPFRSTYMLWNVNTKLENMWARMAYDHHEVEQIMPLSL